MKKHLLIIATLDTKGKEAAYIRGHVQRLGIQPVLMDLGILGEPQTPPDINRNEVLEAAGYHLDQVIRAKDRSIAIKAVQEGGTILTKRLLEDKRLDGVLGIGGGTGTAIATHVMRSLPLGLPKVMLSTVASRDMREYVGTKDIVMFHSVADILGSNEFMRLILVRSPPPFVE